VERLRADLPPGMTARGERRPRGVHQGLAARGGIALGISLVLVLGVIYLFLGNAARHADAGGDHPGLHHRAPSPSCMRWVILINVLTLLGLVLAIGLVVDDAIVVLENIYRRIEGGQPPLVAAIDGSREIGFAVIATTLVLVSVFVPISFLPGALGRLFREFGLTLAAAVILFLAGRVDADAGDDSRLFRPARSEPASRRGGALLPLAVGRSTSAVCAA
jgi:multidrug efflux pump